jgi:hypothetical protein
LEKQKREEFAISERKRPPKFVRSDGIWKQSENGILEAETEFFWIKAEGDDRNVLASRVIAKTSLASNVMHDLNLSIMHRGRDNVGGTVIGGCGPTFVEVKAERLFRWLIHVSSLEFDPATGTDFLSVDELRCVLLEWSGEDHHANDPAYRANFLAKPSKAHIASRLMQSSS